jgi:hypothetical protein
MILFMAAGLPLKHLHWEKAAYPGEYSQSGPSMQVWKNGLTVG